MASGIKLRILKTGSALKRMFSNMLSDKTEKVKISVDSIYNGHHQVTYKGIRAVRCPFDYVIYQMIICDLRPDLVIEIGTSTGGGALYIADLMDNIGHGFIHTIDIVAESDPVLKEHPRIKLFTEGWQGYDKEKETRGFKKILVIDDASHMYEDTADALNKFASLVSKDSYFIVEDGIVNELGRKKEFHGGPLKAIREFLASNKNFEIDRKWCDLFGTNATFNVNGYLKRK